MHVKVAESPLCVPQTERRAVTWLVVVAGVALAALVASIAWSPPAPVYDEEAHLMGACLLVGYDRESKSTAGGEKLGLREMLVADIPSAPGPLYPLLHAAFYPLTGLEAPRVRFLNYGLFVMACSALAFGFSRWRDENSWGLPAMMLALPGTWATVGLAYTEIPAFAMAAFALAAAAWGSSRPEGSGPRSYLGFGLAGVCGGLAIVGRQTYLPLLLAFAAVGLFQRRWRWAAWLGLSLAALIPLPMFLAWGGLTRRELQHTMGGGLALTHLVVAFAWLGLTLGWLAPRFFSTDRRWVVATMAAAAGANLLFFHLSWCAYDGLLAYLPDWLGRWYNPLVGSVLVAAAAGFVVAAAIHAWRRRADGTFLLGLAITVALTATAIGIVHLYTPRYVMVAFPSALLVARPFFLPSKWAMARLAVGSGFGAASLMTYYAAAFA